MIKVNKFTTHFLPFFIIAVFCIGFSARETFGQRDEPLPDSIREKMIEMEIEDQKEDFQELVARSEEVVKLTGEIEVSYNENKKLTADDREKLSRVEDLLEKIRKELRARKDKEKIKPPKSMTSAVQSLREDTIKLLEEIKKTSRYSISVVAIQSTNAVLKIVEFLRFGKD
ncbi:MAG: hypothetical protein KDB79_00845 [Acidobacteria bacterium]|nr:hypothetical protein [Acidobacteriota bacterium]